MGEYSRLWYGNSVGAGPPATGGAREGGSVVCHHVQIGLCSVDVSNGRRSGH